MPEIRRHPRLGRGQGQADGRTKRAILLYIFEHPEGVVKRDIQDLLQNTFGIRQGRGIDDHLTDLETRNYITKDQPEGPGTANYWYPTNDIAVLKKIWLDTDRCLRFKETIEDQIALLSTKQGKEFVRTEIATAFIEAPVSTKFKGCKLFSYLPSVKTIDQGLMNLNDVCIWACESCPTLITHLIRPNKEILLCISMILNDSLAFEESGTLSFNLLSIPDQMVPTDYFRIIEQLQNDWKNLRFSTAVSKEMICILTMMVALFSFAEEYPEKSKIIFKSTQFAQLWNLFESTLTQTKRGERAVPDAVRMMFALTFAKKIFV
jgi:hypothetical protein